VTLAIPGFIIAASGWRPGIGDPSFGGWATVVGYLVAAGLCLWAGRRERAIGLPPRGRVWFLLAAGGAALAVNKQLDFQVLFGQEAKRVAQWLEVAQHQKLLQAWFIGGLAGVAVLLLIALMWWTRKHWSRYCVSLVGMVFLSGFVLVRGSSFHDVEWFFGQSVAGWGINRLMQWAGILLIAGGAGWFLAARRHCRAVGERQASQGQPEEASDRIVP
jgi:hypothetical protein